MSFWRQGACLLIALLPMVVAAANLDEVARLKEGPGNITLTMDGRIIVSMHQFFEGEKRVAEVIGVDGLRDWPNLAWARGANGYIGLDSVLGLQSDKFDLLWMLDNALRGGGTPKLVAWDSRRDRLEQIIYLPPPITVQGSFVNDLAVDDLKRHIYIADPAPGDQAALIVVDIETGLARRVLQGHPSVVAEDIDLIIDGKALEVRRADGSRVKPRIGVNPIALDARGEWLYFGPMHGHSLYRIRTRDLRDMELDAATLATRVERYSDKPICDGISIDKAGNIYISDIANSAIGVIDGKREYKIWVQDPRLSWPDAFSFGADGYLYTVANQLHRSARLNSGVSVVKPPYLIMRVKGLAPGVPGR